METKKRIHLGPAQTFKLASWVHETHEKNADLTHIALALLAQDALGFVVTPKHIIAARKATGVYVKRRVGRPKSTPTPAGADQQIDRLASEVSLLRREISEIRVYLFGTPANKPQSEFSLQD